MEFGYGCDSRAFSDKGLGLHNDLQNEHSIVGNNVGVLLMAEYGSAEQKGVVATYVGRETGFAFGITEPAHGSDATHMETNAVRDGDGWKINGAKTWNTGFIKPNTIWSWPAPLGKPAMVMVSQLFLRLWMLKEQR